MIPVLLYEYRTLGEKIPIRDRKGNSLLRSGRGKKILRGFHSAPGKTFSGKISLKGSSVTRKRSGSGIEDCRINICAGHFLRECADAVN